MRLEDSLGVTIVSSDATVTGVLLTGRFWDAQLNRVVPIAITANTGAIYTRTTQFFQLGEGYLMNLEAVTVPGGTTRGRVHLNVELLQGTATAFQRVAGLISDYISRMHNAAWPVGEYVASTESTGWARSVTAAASGAGAEIVETVPTGARWRLKAIRFRLVTSAAVANRSVRLILDDGVNPFYITGLNFVQAASITEDYGLGIGVTGIVDAGGGVATAPIPDNALFAGFRWRTNTINIQAADQYSFAQYLVEEWIEN